MRYLLGVIPVLLLVAQALGAPLIDEPVAELKLRNGKILHDVVVRSFAESAVMVQHRNGVQGIAYEQFPSEYQAALKANRPQPKAPSGPTTEERIRAAREDERRKANAAQQQQNDARRARREQAQAEDAATTAVYRHARAARRHAESYFEHNYQVGSGSVVVYRLEVQLEQPEEVSGWTGRFRTRGVASFGYYDSPGGSFNRVTRSFEVVTQEKGMTITMADFALR